LLHGEWCTRNFISGRSLVRAFDVRSQLSMICGRPIQKNGLGMNIEQSCGEDMEAFLKCACAGLFLQSASRLSNSKEVKGRGSGSLESTRGRFKTKVGNTEVSAYIMAYLVLFTSHLRNLFVFDLSYRFQSTQLRPCLIEIQHRNVLYTQSSW
jgi:hypothetical protein